MFDSTVEGRGASRVTIVGEATIGRSVACVPHGFPERVLFYKEAPIFLVFLRQFL